MRHTLKNVRIINARAFGLGVLLLFLGIWGGIWQWWSFQQDQLDQIMTDKVVFLAQVSVADVINKNTQISFTESVDVLLEKKLGLTVDRLQPWVGGNVGLAMLESEQVVLAAQYRNKTKAEKFVNEFLAENETFVVEDTLYGKIWKPSFSSQMVFGFHEDWLFWSDSEAGLVNALVGEKKLKSNELYSSVRKDLPGRSPIKTFIDLNRWKAGFWLADSLKVYQPLFQAVGEAVPAVGLAVDLDKENFALQAKFLLHEEAYDDRLVGKLKNKTIPDLADFVPTDSLFFINGTDLYAKYVHTKAFLAELNPQFSIIFDGLLKAQASRVFGTDFDFEKDFLSSTRGQYAFALDMRNQLQLIFMTEIDEALTSPRLSEIQDKIHQAQAQITHKVETVELADGSQRQEVVAFNPNDIPMTEVDYQSRQYYTTEGLPTNHDFAYGVTDKYFVFATNGAVMKSLFDAKDGRSNNLSKNADFRESILFDFSASESYGFLNVGKLAQAVTFVNEIQEKPVPTWLEVLRTQVRTITFSRKVFPGEAIVRATFFGQ